MRRFVVAFLAGAFLAGVGLLLGDRAAPVPVVADPNLPPAVVWVRPGESVFANAVLVPESLSVEGSSLNLEYRLEPLGSSPFGAGSAVPETWLVTTDTGDEIVGTTANPRARTARFPVPDGFTPGRVAAITLTGWRLRTPLQYDIEIHLAGTAAVLLADGTEVTVATVLRQSTDTRVRLDLDFPEDAFVGAEGGDRPFLLAGAGWENAGSTFGPSPGVQIKYVGDGAPRTAPLVVIDAGWRPFAASVPVTVPGVRDG